MLPDAGLEPWWAQSACGGPALRTLAQLLCQRRAAQAAMQGFLECRPFNIQFQSYASHASALKPFNLCSKRAFIQIDTFRAGPYPQVRNGMLKK